AGSHRRRREAEGLCGETLSDDPGVAVLERFGLTDRDMIALTGESTVYVLDDERVLRLRHAERRTRGDDPHGFVDYQLRRAALCNELPPLSFQVPRLLDHGEVAGEPYTVEARIPGQSLDLVLRKLSGERRVKALVAYADAAREIASIEMDRKWYGELMLADEMRFKKWRDYLLARTESQVLRARPRLVADGIPIEDIVEDFGKRTKAIAHVKHGLVHGDFFPGNVLVSKDLRVTGVIDFGFSTLVGDPRMDMVGASCFLEVSREFSTPQDAHVVRSYLRAKAGIKDDIYALYRTYYALYFAFTHEFGLKLYDWCLETLREQRP
ncbi:MAG: aminoglycoside phosphotransferase family protein, partial [Actinomycetota bacterium]